MAQPEESLSPELLAKASIRGNEYGWRIADFPDVLRDAHRRNLACLGGQFQFRLPDAICEMYWLNADASDRQSGESWSHYVERTYREVLSGFQSLVAATDFCKEAAGWKSPEDKDLSSDPKLDSYLWFVAYFEAAPAAANLPP